MEKIGDAVRNFEERFMDAAIPVVQGAVLLLPPVGITNDIMTLSTGEDMYENKATTPDKAWAWAGVVSLGVANTAKGGIRSIGKVVNKGLDFISAGRTIYKENEKRNEKK